MKFSALANFLARLESTPSRNEMTVILAELLAQSSVEEVEMACHLVLGQLAPKYRKIDFNVAEKLMVRVISLWSGLTESEALAQYQTQGDLGDLVYQLAQKNQDESRISVNEVYDRLLAVAQEEGAGSVDRKVKSLVELLGELDPLSAKYVARIPVGRLRLGFSDITILDALSQMVQGDKGARKEIEAAYNVRADIGQLAKLIKESGLEGLDQVSLTPGVPLRNALAERLPSAEKIVEKIGKDGVIEPKYDGLRVQVHLDRDQLYRQTRVEETLFADQSEDEPLVKIYSRSLEDMTMMFPDVVKQVKGLKGVRSLIADGEAVGYDPATGKLVPFQETIQRKRKHGVKEKSQTLPLRVYLFDLLYLDGQSLLAEPFSVRRKKLVLAVGQKEADLRAIDQIPLKNPAQLRELFEEFLGDGLEGVVVKKSESLYQAGGRSYNWVKFKKTTEEGRADTVDGLVMGYYAGRGKRNEFGLGAFLVGVQAKKGEWVTLAKIGTGLSDDQWRKMFDLCQPLKTKIKPDEYRVAKGLVPDVWVRPEIVVEVMADEITKSPNHTCCFDPQTGKGLAMRFPRLIKFRTKSIDQLATEKEIEKMYKDQRS